MSDQHAQALPLQVPRTEQPAPEMDVSHARTIAREIFDLPYADVSVAMTIARSKLYNINRLTLTPEQRAAILAPFNYAFRKCIDYYRDFHQHSRFMEQPPAEDLAELSLFTQEMAFGYKRVFLDFLDASQDQTLIAKALYAALYFAGQSMLQGYERNLWQSPRLWQEIHCLYQVAEQRGFLSEEITSEQPKPRPNTIEGIYCQILLTALADPYQLDHGRHWLVYDYAGRWCQQVMLYPVTAMRQKPDHGFVVKLDSGKPPLPLKGFQTLNHRSLRLLDTDRLSSQLDQQIAQLKSGEQPLKTTGLETHLSGDSLLRVLEHLHAHWSDKPFRSNDREARKEKIQLIWGIQDLFRLHDPQARRQASEAGQPIHLEQRTAARIEDESPHGYCLVYPPRFQHDVRAGQLVCVMRRSEGKHRLELGTVRWANALNDELMRAGVRKIQASVRSVQVAFEAQGEHDFQGLLLSREYEGRTRQSLIVPQGFLQSGSYAYTHQPGTANWCRTLINAQRSQSDIFDWFEVELAL